MTQKYEEGFISLRSRTNSSEYKINSVFKQFYFFTKDFDNVKLVFIELPIYSIYWWNKVKGHSIPEEFKSDDCILRAQIDMLNQYIRDFNRPFHVHSPSLSNDLIKSRKQGKHKHSFCSYTFYDCGYKDGIHHCEKLYKLWLLNC